MFEAYDKLVAAFLADKKRNCLTERSIENYTDVCRLFRESMERNRHEEVNPVAVADFKADKSGVSLATLSQYLTILRLLSDFGVEMGIIRDGFVPDVLMPPKKKVANERRKEYTHVLTSEQAGKLLTARRPLKGRRKARTWLREKAIVTLLIQSGLRNSELLALTPSDLDFENSIITARITKGDKPRRVAFPMLAQMAVRAYMDSGLRKNGLPDTAPLFGCENKSDGAWRAMGREELSSRVFSYTGAVLGEEHACRTHALRHAYASLLLDADVPIQYISESLGHSSIATTTIYAKRLQKAVPAKEIGNVFNKLIAAV